jgi:hypothetical protein
MLSTQASAHADVRGLHGRPRKGISSLAAPYSYTQSHCLHDNEPNSWQFVVSPSQLLYFNLLNLFQSYFSPVSTYFPSPLLTLQGHCATLTLRETRFATTVRSDLINLNLERPLYRVRLLEILNVARVLHTPSTILYTSRLWVSQCFLTSQSSRRWLRQSKMRGEQESERES